MAVAGFSVYSRRILRMECISSTRYTPIASFETIRWHVALLVCSTISTWRMV